MGFVNNVLPFSLIVWGQTKIGSGLAAILNATTSLFAAVIAHAVTRDERVSGNRLAGVLAGFLGVAVMIGPATHTGLGSDVLAQLAVLGAALSYAVAGFYGRRFKKMGVAPIVTATGQVAASAVLLVPLALPVEHPWTRPYTQKSFRPRSAIETPSSSTASSGDKASTTPSAVSWIRSHRASGSARP